MLQWNSQSGQYEATVNGQLVQVDGDEFSEERAKLQQEYQQRGMSYVSAWGSDI